MSIKRLVRFKHRFLFLFALASVLTVISGVYFIRFLAKPNTGLVVNYPEVINLEGKIIFSPKTPFSPAVASGMKANTDQIISINGQVVKTIRDVVEADASIWRFDPIPVEIVRNNVLEQTILITPAVTLTRLDWVFALIFCIALAFTSFYLIIHLPEDTASNFIALAALFYLVFTALKPFYYESFFSNLLVHVGRLTPWLMVFFGMYFPTAKGKVWLRRTVVFSILALSLVYIGIRMVYFQFWATSGLETWLIRYRFLGKLHNIADGIAFLIYAVLLLGSYFKNPHLKEKRQIEWILAGFLIGIPPYFFLDQLPIILGGAHGLRISMGNFANLFLSFVPLFFIVGLLKHGVFNIKFFINRYLAYVLLAVLIFSFFTVLYEPIQSMFIRSYGLPAHVSAFLVVTLLFILLIPLRTVLTNLLERLFYRSHYKSSLEYSANLEKRNMELRLIIDELNRQNIRSFQTDKLRELRGIITGIAHRVNNPVNFISSSLRSLDKKLKNLFKELDDRKLRPQERKSLETDMVRFLQIAQEGNFEIRDFIRNLVSLVGSRSTIPVSVNVSHLLKNAEMELQEKHGQVDLSFKIKNDVKLTCYPGELIQALYYILENAAEAGEDGQIRIEAEKIDGYLVIQIEDHGMGIDDLNNKKIFDPFFTTKAGHEGLGLYFCRTIVERNSGSIEIESRPGEGTRVKLILTQTN
ncbi:MAG TPA: hypothetical protein ENI27_05165 [bacterium]|nr:hypothetical protein [bacterium]